MIKELWINLPIKDLERSKKFFTALGFTLNDHYSSDDGLSFFVGSKEIILMLFLEESFKGFTGHELSDPAVGSEVLFSIDAESKEEVDALAQTIVAAGGKLNSQPDGQGWLYGFGFQDPDGHRWNVLYMDMTQMPTS